MSDLETRRRELAADIAASAGKGWREPFAPGSSGCHELLDRTAMLVDLVERYLVEHAACVENPAWFKLATEAAERLHALYQSIGEVHLGKDEPVA
jgi:hypothetical protein